MKMTKRKQDKNYWETISGFPPWSSLSQQALTSRLALLTTYWCSVTSCVRLTSVRFTSSWQHLAAHWTMKKNNHKFIKLWRQCEDWGATYPLCRRQDHLPHNRDAKWLLLPYYNIVSKSQITAKLNTRTSCSFNCRTPACHIKITHWWGIETPSLYLSVDYQCH